jgi:catechol 2,3-dioxygenase-like lactoylglutathione lyase family enzyme
MPLTKMEHFLVITADLQATRDFYCRVLGMREGVLARLQQHGVQPARNVTHASGLKQLFLFDPNGVKIEINFPPGS